MYISLYLVSIKLDFCLIMFTKNGKELFCDIERFVLIVPRTADLQFMNVSNRKPHLLKGLLE